MWIRSQDKMILIDTKNIHVSHFSFSNCYQFEVCIDSVNTAIIAEYSSEWKALKVMDMIQNAITGTRFEFTDIVRDCDLAGIEIHNVFNMPQDSEVKE